MNARRPLFKVVSLIVAFTFFISQIGWASGDQYIPFDETQTQSQFLAAEQLQRFSDIKNNLVEQHNSVSSPPLQTEEEIINYLYSAISPQDYTTLGQLENNYNASVAEKEAAWQAFTSQKILLEDYYKTLDYLSASLQSIYSQIESVKQKKASVEQDKQAAQNKITDLESQRATKDNSAQNKLQEAALLESTINDLKNALSLLNDEKTVRKKDLDDAETLYNEKTSQKETLESDLSSLQGDISAKQAELQAAEDALALAQSEYDSAIADVHSALGPAFDIHTSTYDKIYDGDGNLIGVNIPGHSPDAAKESILLTALYKDAALQAAQDLVTQKQNELAVLQAAYDTKLTEYNALLTEYNAAKTAYETALAAYQDKTSAVDALQDDITQNEIDLLSDYEQIRVLEHDINALDEEITTTTTHYQYLGSMLNDLSESLARLNTRGAELEDLYAKTLNDIEQELEDTGTNDKLYEFRAAVENERRAKSAYISALEARSQLINSLRKPDKKLQLDILEAILGAPVFIPGEEQGEIQSSYDSQTIVLTAEEINNLLLTVENDIVLAGGRTSSEARRNREAVIRSLRENYNKVFGKEPTDRILSAFLDIITKTKIPAIRLFEVIKRIQDKNLKATEDEKLDVEDSAIDPGDIDQEAGNNLLRNIINRLQDNSVSSELIKGAVSYLTTLPSPLISCGLIALDGLFNMMGKNVAQDKIAEEAILTDILAGSINKDTTGQLQLSLYALKEAAEANGETLYGRKLNADDLENATSPFIAHVNGNHYVLVRKIENGMVTYFDPDPGMDLGTSVKDFGRSFTGFALTTNDKDGGTALQDDEMKSVFGAGWWSRAKKAVKKAVKKVTKTVKKVAKTVTKTVKKVAKTVTKTVKKVASAVKSTAKKVASAVKSVAKKVSNAVTSTAKKVVNAVTSTAKKVADKVAEKFNEIKEKAETVYNDVKEKVNETREKAEEKWNDTKEKAGELWEKAKEEYNSRKEARNARRQNPQQDKPLVDSLIDFFTIIPSVGAASPDEDDFSGDPFLDENSEDQCSIDNEDYAIDTIFDIFNFTQNDGSSEDPGDINSNTLETDIFSIDSLYNVDDQCLYYTPSEDAPDYENIEIDPDVIYIENVSELRAGSAPHINTINCNTRSTYVPGACEYDIYSGEWSWKRAISGAVGFSLATLPVCLSALSAGALPGVACFIGSPVIGAFSYQTVTYAADEFVPEEQKTLATIGVGISPGVGDSHDVHALLFGEDPVTGETDLPLSDRLLSGLVALPVFGLFVSGSGIRGLSKLDEAGEMVEGANKLKRTHKFTRKIGGKKARIIVKAGDKTIHKGAPHIHIGQLKYHFSNMDEYKNALSKVDRNLLKDQEVLDAGRAVLETVGLMP